MFQEISEKADESWYSGNEEKNQKIYTSTAYVLTNNKNNIRHVVRQGPSKWLIVIPLH